MRNKYDVFNGEDEKPFVPKPRKKISDGMFMSFEKQDDIDMADLIMEMKTPKQSKHITIIQKQQKKHIDASTKLF